MVCRENASVRYLLAYYFHNDLCFNPEYFLLNTKSINKKKIINDPVYGFIGVPNSFIYDLISHPWLQRLRNIKQLGLTQLVYPGAVHTRFHHALGSMHLVYQVIDVLRTKGVLISEDEAEAVQAAILLHDIGHGPFSHTLENVLVSDFHHENITLYMMQELSREFQGKLDLSIEIFTNRYHRTFFHQLISGQLDMDRMDYLNRDSFFTGVIEGVIGFDRIIKMLDVYDDRLVVEEKGIYSIEKFLIARRLMYWQVYFHKTVLSAENMLIKILNRAKELSLKGTVLPGMPDLNIFLQSHITGARFLSDRSIFEAFTRLDDHDIMCSVKCWARHTDPVLSTLSQALINRNLYKVQIQNQPFTESSYAGQATLLTDLISVPPELSHYFVFAGVISNKVYDLTSDKLEILQKNGEIKDFTTLSDYFSISGTTRSIEKYYLCTFKMPSTGQSA